MQVSSRITQEHTITDDEGFRVAVVNLSDEAPGKGRFMIVANGMSYSCYWGSMGDHTVLDFFKLTTDNYVMGCLDPFGTMFRRIDPQILKGIIAQDISESGQLDDDKKLALTARLAELSPISDVNGLIALNGPLMVEIYGPMWTNQVNERFLGQHPSYRDLLSTVVKIRAALAG
ncbi:hypothetical protein HOT57_gp84 [Pseudomonas phage phCDa]|uniref:Uncharacterized protein n=1 Tax=Pseudomonas phage phCDa TaxID=2268587 RepID=A0A2Z5HA86_9CAUD|nr:hypothetical protein HOT57_gp84 [Pseudomonas phage phCDa]AXC36528.1 hypothetical protein phCDa_84 [Pseudomonas phage phCDa]